MRLAPILALMTIAVAASAAQESPLGAADAAAPVMTRAKYADYVRLFNSNDHRYAQYYDPDVVFSAAPAPHPLHGRQAILDLYDRLRRQLTEHVTATVVAIDNEHGIMAVELSNRIVATTNHVVLPSHTMNAGDVFIGRGVIFYGLAEGRITSIRSARIGGSFIPAAQNSGAAGADPAPESVPNPSAAPVAGQGGAMTRPEYADYLSSFDSGSDHYADYYAPDVVFDHGPYGILRGRQAIVDFYHGIRKELRETVTASEVVIDNEHGIMAAEIATRLTALRNGVKLPSHPLDKGDTFVSRGVVFYGLSGGRIVSIRGAHTGSSFVPAHR